MQPVEGLEDIVEHRLQLVQHLVRQRNQYLNDAQQQVLLSAATANTNSSNNNNKSSHLTTSAESGDAPSAQPYVHYIEEIEHIREGRTPQLLRQVALLAQQVNQSAQLADTSSRTITRLDFLRKRIELVRAAAKAAEEKKRTIKQMETLFVKRSTTNNHDNDEDNINTNNNSLQADVPPHDHQKDNAAESSSGPTTPRAAAPNPALSRLLLQVDKKCLAPGESLDRTVAMLCSYDRADATLQRQQQQQNGGAEGKSSSQNNNNNNNSGSYLDMNDEVPLVLDQHEKDMIAAARKEVHQVLVSLCETLLLQRLSDSSQAKNSNNNINMQNANASRESDQKQLQHYCQLLAQLRYEKEGSAFYIEWVVKTTLQTVESLVTTELTKIKNKNKSSNSVKEDENDIGGGGGGAPRSTVVLSHLALVSQCLDTVVAALEAEESFIRTTFHAEGMLRLLEGLDRGATSACVPVLESFLDERQGALLLLEQQQQRESDPNNTNAMSSPHSFDARQLDKVLEEMSHLVSCCHLYFSFMEKKQNDYRAREVSERQQGDGNDKVANPLFGSEAKEEEEEKQKVYGSANNNNNKNHINNSGNNNLLMVVQDILARYVPLQLNYFQSAYLQAAQLQRAAVLGYNREVKKRLRRAQEAELQKRQQQNGGSGNGAKPSSRAAPSAAAIMSGLSTIYSELAAVANMQSSASSASSEEDEDDDEDENNFVISKKINSETNKNSVDNKKAKRRPMSAAKYALLQEQYFQQHTRSLLNDFGDAAMGGGGGGGARGGRANRNGNSNNMSESAITLVDDCFFFLRMAFHRALVTKNIQIASAVVLNGLNTVLQDYLFTDIKNNIENNDGAVATAAAQLHRSHEKEYNQNKQQRPDFDLRGITAFMTNAMTATSSNSNNNNNNNNMNFPWEDTMRRFAITYNAAFFQNCYLNVDHNGGVSHSHYKVNSNEKGSNSHSGGASDGRASPAAMGAGGDGPACVTEISTRALRWTLELEKAIRYVRLLAKELLQLAQMHYNKESENKPNANAAASSDYIRLSEMANDMFFLATERERDLKTYIFVFAMLFVHRIIAVDVCNGSNSNNNNNNSHNNNNYSGGSGALSTGGGGGSSKDKLASYGRGLIGANNFTDALVNTLTEVSAGGGDAGAGNHSKGNNNNGSVTFTSSVAQYVHKRVQYNISEQTFFQYEMYDPWVQRCCERSWCAHLRYIAEYLFTPASAAAAAQSLLLTQQQLQMSASSSGVTIAGTTATAAAAAAATKRRLQLQQSQQHLLSCFGEFFLLSIQLFTREMKSVYLSKVYNNYGALQIDKEIRFLRSFFTEKCDLGPTAVTIQLHPNGRGNLNSSGGGGTRGYGASSGFLPTDQADSNLTAESDEIFFRLRLLLQPLSLISAMVLADSPAQAMEDGKPFSAPPLQQQQQPTSLSSSAAAGGVNLAVAGSHNNNNSNLLLSSKVSPSLFTTEEKRRLLTNRVEFSKADIEKLEI